MKKIITYGTFDLFHEGHQRLLERAKKLGDYLIVGVTTDNYDESRGKLNVRESLMKRIENVKNSGLADEIIIEEYEGQKINDVQRFNIDVFAIGSDWLGAFDYLREYCEVVYLERTKGISSTYLRSIDEGVLRLGMVGYGRIASRFVRESKYVSGVNVEGIYGTNILKMREFVDKHEISFFETDIDQFFGKIDAVYIASPHLTHIRYAKEALNRGIHVLCEKPMGLSGDQVKELFELGEKNKCVIVEAIKTAFSPGFIRLLGIAKSGQIGQIKNVDATFTKIVEGELRELRLDTAGGSVTELGSYPLLAIIKLLGTDYQEIEFTTYMDESKGIDLYTQINLHYANAIASAKVGLGVKSEGNLVISGTRGYIYVPAPWWKTEYFEVRFENQLQNNRYFIKFEGDGLRYELAEFVSLIHNNELSSYKLMPRESENIAIIIEKFLNGNNVKKIV